MLSPLYLSFAFIYIRPGKGTKNQINKILIDYKCEDCDVIMGDLNLNPNNAEEKIEFFSYVMTNLKWPFMKKQQQIPLTKLTISSLTGD